MNTTVKSTRVALSPLPSEQLRSLIIMAAREGQAAIGRGPNALTFAAECLETAATLVRDYYAADIRTPVVED